MVWQKAREKSKRNREGKREKGEDIGRNEHELLRQKAAAKEREITKRLQS